MRLAVALLAALALGSPVLADAPKPPSFAQEAKRADVIFIGTLVAVEKAPGYWSGDSMVLQTLTYEVETVTKGKLTFADKVYVPYLIVGGAPYVTKDAEVAPRLTKIGARYEVLQRKEPTYGLLAIDARPRP